MQQYSMAISGGKVFVAGLTRELKALWVAVLAYLCPVRQQGVGIAHQTATGWDVAAMWQATYYPRFTPVPVEVVVEAAPYTPAGNRDGYELTEAAEAVQAAYVAHTIQQDEAQHAARVAAAALSALTRAQFYATVRADLAALNAKRTTRPAKRTTKPARIAAQTISQPVAVLVPEPTPAVQNAEPTIEELVARCKAKGIRANARWKRETLEAKLAEVGG